MSTKQSGFSAIIIIVCVVVVIGVLGLIGWRLYSQPSTKTNNATSHNTSTSNPSDASNNNSPATPQPTYLDIKEFGIKIPLDNSIADATYTYDPSSSSNANPTESQLVNVTTKSLASASDNKCNVQVITRTQDQNLMGTPLVPNYTNIFKFGNYYYILNGIQFVCSTDKNVQQLLYQQSATFAQDFKAAQPDN